MKQLGFHPEPLVSQTIFNSMPLSIPGWFKKDSSPVAACHALAIFGATFNSDITAYWIIATYLTEHPPTASLSHLVLSHFRDLLPPPRDSHLFFVNTLDQILVKTLPEAQRTQAIESKT